MSRLLLLMALFVIAAPADAQRRSTTTPQPVGVGGDINKLRRSPCACIEVPNPAGLPDFLQVPARPV